MDAGRTLALAFRIEGAMAEEPFEDVFRRILPRAVRVARRILGNETRAEDAAAEALARAHASWSRVGSKPYRDAWILRVTSNVAVDMGRRERHTFPSGLDQQAPESDDPEGALSRVDLAAALAMLPRRQREVVILQYLEGFSEAEIAAALGVSAGTVKKNGFRARETLRKKLGTELDAS